MFSDPQTFIRSQLELKPVPGCPDIKLWQATPTSRLSQLYADLSTEGPAPYWAYVWGGGMALALFLDQHPGLVREKSVLDLGTGSGLVAICAAKAGARSVLACDVDPYALAATQINASENDVRIETLCNDLLDQDPPEVELILVGDLFYEAETSQRVLAYLTRCRSAGIDILVGDPGRQHLPEADLELIAEFDGYDFANVEGAKSRLYIHRLK